VLLPTSGAVGEPNTPGDPTPPQVTPVIFGTLGANNWYTTNATLNWTVVDPESVILSTSGCDAATISSDTTAQTFTCSASSDGGTTTVTKTIKVDKTAPTVTAAPSRPADSNGWYNHAVSVSFSGADGTSGIDSCSATKSYSSPDSSGASVSGSCTDKAGNVGTASFGLQYDATAPTGVAAVPARAPDSNGWYNHALPVSFSGTDGTSGIAGCTQTAYSGPDNGSASVAGACVDVAGNVSASATFGLQYDAAGPSVTATPARGADANGWYNHALSVSYSGTDATSGGVSCVSARTYSSPDDATASVTGSCTDKAGNTTSKTFGLKYDGTAPSVSTTPARTPDSNGWYNRALNVSFAGADGTSGLSSCTGTQTYDGPDSGSASVTGSCLDNAGNVGTASVPIKYDSTPPTAAGSAGRNPDANGWYNHAVAVGFSGTDVTSGVDTCTQTSYSGPDTGNASVSGTCTDKAGNRSATSTFGLKYDSAGPSVTASPSRQPDANGWYNHALTVSFSGADTTSGVDSCAAAKTYSTPDSGTATVSGTCTDKAGNVGSVLFGLKYDSTAPSVTATPGRSADSNGWYNHALTVSFSGADGMSGNDTCVGPQTYSGPDNGTGSVNGSCQDKAGNVGTSAFPLAYDATAPDASATLGRGPDANGWYDQPVTVSFGGTDGTSGIASCTAQKTYSGPDTGSAAVSGSCADKAGNVDPASVSFQYDSTAPSVVGTPSRAADSNGWYNHALTVSFSGTDGTSGLGSCSQATYSAPDDGSASVGGTCTDKAGNTGTGSFALKYDATAPASVTGTRGRNPDSNGWYNHPLTVQYGGSDATSGIASCTQMTYSGPDSGGASVSGTCSDKAGNTSGAVASTFQFDDDGPSVTATPSRGPDANGWYNHALTVSFSGIDAVSGGVTCDTPVTYSAPDSATASLGGSCFDKAGNLTSVGFPLQYDGTKPVVTATAGRAPDVNGWYNHALGVSFSGNDAMSGVTSCVPQIGYSGPDSATAAATGTCTDKAGNTDGATLQFKYDDSGPIVAATPARQPDANGWYNHALTVSFSGSDGVSGLASCVAPKAYSGPDNGSAAVTGSCGDLAGNTTSRTFSLPYDASPPQLTGSAPTRPPDANGWYNHPLTVAFDGSDATSGIASCSQPTYDGPDGAGASVGGTCSDKAGNTSAPGSASFKYDGTPPTVAGAVPMRPADRDGWYTHPIGFAFSGQDSTSGLDDCPAVMYSGPDRSDAAVTGTCVDLAGNQGTATFPLQYDATAPSVVASPTRAPDVNGWYNRPLSVAFSGNDAVSGLDTCSAASTYTGPDSRTGSVTGTCSDKAGNVGFGSLGLEYDATAPRAVGGVPSRPPDARGWYNHGLTVGFAGVDDMSGIATCSQGSYGGPDNPNASVAGSCVDKAGNVAAATPFGLRYDATPPSVADVTVVPGNRTATVRWSVSPDTIGVTVARTAGTKSQPVTVYRGSDTVYTDRGLTDNVRYRYTVTAFDAADNSAAGSGQATPTAPLFSPPAGARLTGPPRLAWKAIPKARYYNVQVWRRKKIFSAWPTGTSLRLPRAWTFQGRRYRLAPGRYRWYVWPGFGARSAKRYGSPLGSSSFVIVAR